MATIVGLRRTKRTIAADEFIEIEVVDGQHGERIHFGDYEADLHAGELKAKCDDDASFALRWH
jgi:hypothetical protein